MRGLSRILDSPALGGVGVSGYSMMGQVIIQATGVPVEMGREGLDTATHGEGAYNL